MTFPAPTVDPRSPPGTLPELTDWFEELSDGLVLLQPYRLSEIRAAIDRLRHSVRLHIETSSALPAARAPDGPLRDLAATVEEDHAWFQTSFEELDGFFGIVERDDHGGNRQALGQHGRLLAEALRRHLADEGLLSRLRSHDGGAGTGFSPGGGE